MLFRNALQLRGDFLEDEYLDGSLRAGPAKQQGIELPKSILSVLYPKGRMFFLEGQSATGVFLLRTGLAKESVVSNGGKTAIVRVVGPGSILGLAAVLTGTPHESTIETLEPARADFVGKAHFLDLLTTSPELSRVVASHLSHNCKDAYATIRRLGVSISVSERLARLLLQWAERPLANRNRNRDTAGIRIRVTMTQEEISQLIGSSRETTSRILGEFRKKKWITTNGSIWTITNKAGILRLAAV